MTRTTAPWFGALQCALIFALSAVASVAAAQPHLEEVKTKGVALTKSGAVSANASHNVRVAGQGSLPVSKIADRVFAKPRELAGKLKKAKSTLVGDPRIEERFSETPTATVFVSKTTLLVKDPVALRAKVPEFASYHAGLSDRGTFSLSQLSADGKKDYDAFKAGLAAAPAGDPLKEAAAKGDDALLDAIAEGKGEVTITITASIPKEALPIKAGALQKPKMSGGTFDTGAREPWQPALVPDRMSGAAVPLEMREIDLDPGEHGNKKFVGNFVTGFTEDNEFEWEERWNFPSGFFSVGVGAYYGFGLRVPVEVTATLDPIEIINLAKSTPSDVTTTVSAKPVNGDADFYKTAGMKNDDIHEGKELLIEAGAYATVRLRAGWGVIHVNETFPKNLSFDFSQNFEPPFGDCGTKCGFDVWIPATVTHTGINVLGLVKGSAQVGFNVSGKGTVGLDYESLFDGKVVDSSLGSKAKSHHLAFDGPGSKVVKTSLPGLPKPDREAYGYRLKSPTYDWRVTITPGVKGTVEVNAKPFFKLEETIGPFWLPFLDVDLGTVKLKQHKGTNSGYTQQPGRKEFKVLTAQPLDGSSLPVQTPRPSPK